MEVFGPRPDRKPISPSELAKLEVEAEQRTREKRDALPLKQKENIATMVSSFEDSLVLYLGSEHSDAEVLEELKSLFGILGNALLQATDNETHSRAARTADVKAGLTGAAMVLDTSRESRFDIDERKLRTVQRFLDLVDLRVKRFSRV